MNPSRRGFLTSIIALAAAPAIVRVSNIMPVKAMPDERILALAQRQIALGYEATKKAIENNVLYGNVFEVHGRDQYGNRIREILMPGLIKIQGKYADIPNQWSEAFKDQGSFLASAGHYTEIRSLSVSTSPSPLPVHFRSVGQQQFEVPPRLVSQRRKWC